jgi:hypothetical protein
MTLHCAISQKAVIFKMCFNETHFCVCLWENVFSVSLELVKVGGYDFSHPCDPPPPPQSHLFFKRPLVDIVFDIPVSRFCEWLNNFVLDKTLAVRVKEEKYSSLTLCFYLQLWKSLQNFKLCTVTGWCLFTSLWTGNVSRQHNCLYEVWGLRFSRR